MVFPRTVDEQARYLFWRVFGPLHPYVRNVLTTTGILRHAGRHEYLLGTLLPDRSLKEFVEHLVANGYGNHFITWREEGELVNLRFVKNFQYQYHLRIFEDGEVRGHYEYTPECYPFKHFFKSGMERRRDEFYSLIGDWVTPEHEDSLAV